MSSTFRRALPNGLTVARLVIAAAFFATMTRTLRMGPHVDRALWGNIATALFVVAAATDFLDGYLARRWQVVSVFGRIMDPFVDKVLVLGAFVYLASPRFAIPEELSYERFTMTTGVQSWMVVVILARELLVTSIRGVIESRGVSFGADVAGKLKMLIQSIAAPLALGVAVNEGLLAQAGWRLARDIFVWAAVIVTLWSCIPYLIKARVLLQSDREPAR
ncbi:MAG: CDP-diacylglycerol--glycerol-3-phosphate 3-phosphatidyltransferase [Phycisphaerae bacterium]|nr:CDP-diacylglycerol--glycerol-3-phosphate 3-phosphatidyltransferase [Phycisphaerae bacterium]